MSKIWSMFEDGTGAWSSTRFAMLFTVMVSNILTWGLYTYLCIKNGNLIEVPTSLFTLYGAANTLVISAKVFQSNTSEKANAN